MDSLILHTDGRTDKGKERKTATLESRMDQLSDRVAELERRTDRLVLVNQALIELLQSHSGLTSGEITNLINEIDLRDGVLDGKLRPQVIKCSGCGRPVSSARPKCVFCQTVNAVDYLVW